MLTSKPLSLGTASDLSYYRGDGWIPVVHINGRKLTFPFSWQMN
jgi:hypothetical protein